MFPHTNKEGPATLRWLRCMGGVGDTDVGFGQGGRWWVGKTLYGHNSCCIRVAQWSFFYALKGMFVVTVVRHRRPNLGPAILLIVPLPPTCSVSALLGHQSSPRQSHGPATEHKSIHPAIVVLVMLSVIVIIIVHSAIGPNFAVEGAGVVALRIWVVYVAPGRSRAYVGGGGGNTHNPGLLGPPDVIKRPERKALFGCHVEIEARRCGGLWVKKKVHSHSITVRIYGPG
ncbi:hypothetical protein EDD85DRAFT_790263 [Armillaria nabsnona]|nr:hypothetical protein EDD85DRAFT_790263 [Armillaria nabsnona]